MSRKKRVIDKTFKVFCEGDTEYNYFEYIRKSRNISLAIRPINMKGGGYASFLAKLMEDANSNCLAKFIVIDGDRAEKIPGEKDALKKIVEYCRLQNDNKRTPHILIIDYPDFEYVACLHTFQYKGQSVESYIKNELGYLDIDKFKADTNIFKVLVESGKGSVEKLLSSINQNTAVITNTVTVKKSQYEISVQTASELDNLGKRGTNFDDFYKVLRKMDIII